MRSTQKQGSRTPGLIRAKRAQAARTIAVSIAEEMWSAVQTAAVEPSFLKHVGGSTATKKIAEEVNRAYVPARAIAVSRLPNGRACIEIDSTTLTLTAEEFGALRACCAAARTRRGSE